MSGLQPAEAAPAETEPGVPRRRQQLRATTTRENLLMAARAVFAEKGYLATEVADIVGRVPITKGALYHHFGGKERLFEQACRRISQEVHEVASDTVRRYSGDAWTQLIAGIQARFDLIARCPEAQKIMLIDGPSVLGWQRWTSMQAEVTLGPLQRTLDILIEQERIPPQPTAPVARLLLAALNDGALAVAGAADPAGESRIVFAALATLMNGLRSGPARPTRAQQQPR